MYGAYGEAFDGGRKSAAGDGGDVLVFHAPLRCALIVVGRQHGGLYGGLFTLPEGNPGGAQRDALGPHLGLRLGDSDGALGGDNIRTGYKSEDLYLCCSGGYGRDGERCRPDAIGRINSRNTPIQTLDFVTGG